MSSDPLQFAPSVSSTPWLDDVVRRAQHLAEEAARLAADPVADELAMNLERGLLAVRSQGDVVRPLVITLLGGTGVGKSTLFNALLRRPELSPTSIVRCFTKKPQVACSVESRALLTHFDDLGAEWKDIGDTGLDGIALVDTPDIDGMLPENWAVARAMLEQSDIVVFVTDPDRRANMDPLMEAARWAPLKTWVFVLTKSDVTPAEERDSIVADWRSKLARIGLDVPGESIHHVSLRSEPEDRAVDHLRRQLFGVPHAEHRTIRLQNIVSLFRFALGEARLAPLAETAATLHEWEAEKVAEARKLYHSVLSDSQVRQNLQVYVQNRTWNVLAEVFPGPMRLAIWIRARIEQISQSYAIVRLTRGGLASLALAAGANVIAALRSLAPLERILSMQGERIRTGLESIEGDLRRRLEDKGLDSLLATDPAYAPAVKATNRAPTDSVSVNMGPLQWTSPSFDQIVETVKRWTSGLGGSSDPELLLSLRDEVERIVRRNASMIATTPMIIAANLLPVIVLVDATWRLLEAWWWSRTYHALSFYGMAAGMFAACCLPGYWLLSKAIQKQARQIQDSNLEAVASAFDGSPATRQIGDLAKRFDHLSGQADVFRRRLEQIRERLAARGLRLPFFAPGMSNKRPEESLASP